MRSSPCVLPCATTMESTAWCGVAWRGVAWRSMVWCGVAWRGVAAGVTWHGPAWYGVVWCGVVWRGVAWCSVDGTMPAASHRNERIWCSAPRSLKWTSVSCARSLSSTPLHQRRDSASQRVHWLSIPAHSVPPGGMCADLASEPEQATSGSRLAVAVADATWSQRSFLLAGAAHGQRCEPPAPRYS